MADDPKSPAPATGDDPPETTYDPSDVEVTRARQQGLGVGARDLQRQRDPTREPSDDEFEHTPEPGDDPGRV